MHLHSGETHFHVCAARVLVAVIGKKKEKKEKSGTSKNTVLCYSQMRDTGFRKELASPYETLQQFRAPSTVGDRHSVPFCICSLTISCVVLNIFNFALCKTKKKSLKIKLNCNLTFHSKCEHGLFWNV